MSLIITGHLSLGYTILEHEKFRWIVVEISLIWKCKNGLVFTQRLKTQIPLSQVDKNAVQESDTFAFALYSSLRKKTQLVSRLDFYCVIHV